LQCQQPSPKTHEKTNNFDKNERQEPTTPKNKQQANYSSKFPLLVYTNNQKQTRKVPVKTMSRYIKSVPNLIM
jgi:hypothetical protein